ncbi:secG, partial [Symbiodinium sp. CCMP2456]
NIVNDTNETNEIREIQMEAPGSESNAKTWTAWGEENDVAAACVALPNPFNVVDIGSHNPSREEMHSAGDDKTTEAPTPAAANKQTVWWVDLGSWVRMDNETQELMRQAVAEGKSFVEFEARGQPYRADLEMMMQINMRTSMCRAIKVTEPDEIPEDDEEESAEDDEDIDEDDLLSKIRKGAPSELPKRDERLENLVNLLLSEAVQVPLPAEAKEEKEKLSHEEVKKVFKDHVPGVHKFLFRDQPGQYSLNFLATAYSSGLRAFSGTAMENHLKWLMRTIAGFLVETVKRGIAKKALFHCLSFFQVLGYRDSHVHPGITEPVGRILSHLGLELQDDVDLLTHVPCCLQLVKLGFDEEATCQYHGQLLRGIERYDSARTEALLRKLLNPDHRCPKHPRSALQAAISCGSLAAVQVLLEAGSELNGTPYMYMGWEPKFKCAELEATGTPIFQAIEQRYEWSLEVAQQRRRKIVSALIHGRADLTATNSYGKTPLRKAIDVSDVELVQTLLDLRADPNLGGVEAPLFHVVRNHMRGPYSTANAVLQALLVARASLSDPGPIENSLVYLGTQRYSAPENFRLILKWRANLNAVDIETGETALMRACSECDILRIRKLIGMRANVHRADATGRTPLHAVCGETKPAARRWDNHDYLNKLCEATHLEAVKLLVEARANIDACMPDGTTALQLAVQTQKETLASFLRKRKADMEAALASPEVSTPRRAVLLLSRGDKRPRAV